MFLIAMAAMQKSNEEMIKSLTKAMIGKNRAKQMIEDSNKDE